jgi:hypothetical protein
LPRFVRLDLDNAVTGLADHGAGSPSGHALHGSATLAANAAVSADGNINHLGRQRQVKLWQIS